MPQYMLLIYPPADFVPPSDPAESSSRWGDYHDSLAEAGVLLSSGRLQGVQSATTVRPQDGEPLISDGPFAETKEILAGFYLVDCPDLDAALGHAARMPLPDRGAVEVRPMMFPANTHAGEMRVPAQT